MKRAREPRWRAALLRYEDGVHELADPAAEGALEDAARRCGFALPPSLRAFLAAHDGASLFHEAYRILPCAELRSDRIGWEGDAPVAVDAERIDDDGEMPVVRFEAGSEQMFTSASRFDRWLDATMAREELVYQPDGEFRDVFDADTAEIRRDILRKREERALRADPLAPATHFELGRLLAHEGHAGRAIACLERAVELEPGFAWAHFELGRLHRRERPKQAAEAFLRAAALDAEQATVHQAWAAWALTESGDRQRAAEVRSRIRLKDPAFARRYRELGQQLLGAGDPNAADMLGLAWAVDPEDEGSKPLLAEALEQAKPARAARPVRKRKGRSRR